MIGDQTLEGRRDNLSQANKLSRTYAVLLDVLNRYRGKEGQQKVTVGHVDVPAGRRWSAWSRAQGEGANRNRRINPSPRCGARTRSGSGCRSAAMPNGRCRMHGGMSPGAPKGNKNAFRHGHYTTEAIAIRREIAKLLRDARALVKQVS
jgi:hypothetical protein